MRLSLILRLPKSNFVLALRESFLSMLPVFLVMQCLGLALSAMDLSEVGTTSALHQLLTSIIWFQQYFWPVAMSAATAIHLARAYGDDPVYVVVLTLSLMSLAFLSALGLGEQAQSWGWMMLGSVVLPSASVGCMRLVRRALPRVDFKDLSQASPAMAHTLAEGLPFVVSLIVLAWPATLLPLTGGPFANVFDVLPVWLGLMVLLLFENVLWWMGMNGRGISDWATDKVLHTTQPVAGASLADFDNIFNFIGGSGATLALLVCLMWYQRRKATPKVWRWALPLHLFNINEVLTFALPVVGNWMFFVPFVVAPTLNAMITYLVVVEWQWIPVTGSWSVTWVIPHFLKPLMMTVGAIERIWALQIFLFVLSILIYRPFVKRWVQQEQVGEAAWDLANRMNLGPDLELYSEARFTLRQEAQQDWSRHAQVALKLLKGGQLSMHYQPKVEVHSGRVLGFEALLRLKDAQGSNVAPQGYLLPLERVGFGDLLDLWVVRRVVEDMERWLAQGVEVPVAINLTAATLSNTESFERLMRTLTKSPPGLLQVELLESSLIEEPELVRARLAVMRSAGVRVFVDDFGTGYSNLSLFHSADFDVVKIDRSLLEAASNARGERLYREICTTLLRLSYELVAEGVETKAERDFVADCGVTAIQGWWVGRPVPAEQVPGMLNDLTARFRSSRD
jgi:EAL domain-containing protein (putative c-di-GMP-specific phosphodiesterase class I)/cellobiose-specific phosphotransferase system component IIC